MPLFSPGTNRAPYSTCPPLALHLNRGSFALYRLYHTILCLKKTIFEKSWRKTRQRVARPGMIPLKREKGLLKITFLGGSGFPESFVEECTGRMLNRSNCLHLSISISISLKLIDTGGEIFCSSPNTLTACSGSLQKVHYN